MMFGKRCSAGLTLVELICALVVMSIISLAVSAMIAGAANTSLFVTSGTDRVSQVETAYRRILHNLRACSSITTPTTTTAGSTLTLVTQPDSSNGNATYTVTYALSNGSLTESDSRYTSANTLATGVTGFTVKRISLTSPQSVAVTITAGSNPVVTRSVTIYCRNL